MESSSAQPARRTKVACEECRKNKRKCDGQKPACFLCAKFDRHCTYLNELSRKRRNRDEELIRNLESQVQLLESALLSRGAESNNYQDGHPQTIRMEECHNPASQTSDSSALQEQGLSGTSVVAGDMRSDSAMDELASLMLEMDIEEKGEPSFTIAAGRRRPSQLDQTGIHDVGQTSNQQKRMMTAIDVSPETIRHLVDCFITHFNPFHQFIEPHEKEQIIHSGTEVADLGLSFRNAALLAVGSCFSDHEDAKATGLAYFDLASSLPLISIKQCPGELVVQGLVLLSWHELMFGMASSAYNYVGMATGQILYLGYHVAALRKPADLTQVLASRAVNERTIRTFWSYFSVDRLITSSLGMNCTLHWQRVRLPPFSNIVEGQLTLDEAAHEAFCELWHLWDSGMDQVYAFGWGQLTGDERAALVLNSHQSLTGFHARIDDRLRLRRDYLPDIAVWFQMAYHTALLLVHRPLLGEPRDRPAAQSASRLTTASALAISSMIRSYRKNKRFGSMSPQVVDYVVSAAVIHLLNATSGKKSALGRQSMSGIRTCLDALQDMHHQWPSLSTRSIRQIQDLANRWKVVWALPSGLAGRPVGMAGTGIATQQHLVDSAATRDLEFEPISEDLGFPEHTDSPPAESGEINDPLDFWNMDDIEWSTLIFDEATPRLNMQSLINTFHNPARAWQQ
ncbi:hypothetical protein B0A52_04145 [Exophiala mesophila]|uniref:Zn(2)-C6 fungal-type domain-containing protein n=1 Tax=Exophiala mesophila TaxID=212818 RepID=A0A438NAV4_EXOME|nr:hypothetical protein B0A52_04145 [Exophiala mesophila]